MNYDFHPDDGFLAQFLNSYVEVEIPFHLSQSTWKKSCASIGKMKEMFKHL